MNVWRRRILRVVSGLVLAGTGLFIAAYFLLQSEWLREQIRQRALREIQTATGGRAEMSRFDFNPRTWVVTIENFVLHGTEPASAPPLFRAPRITLGLKVLSFLNQKVDLQSIAVESPELHLLRGADGALNLPSPGRAVQRKGAPLAELMKLAVDEFRASDGVFTYEQKTQPFAFAGRALEARFAYSVGDLRYDGAIRSRQFSLELPGKPRVTGDFSTEVSLYENSVTISKFRVDSGRTFVEGVGAILDLGKPSLTLNLSGQTDLGETPFVRIPGSGPVSTAGVFTFRSGDDYRYEGEASAREVKTEWLTGIRATTRVLLTPAGAQLSRLEIDSAEGRFTGEVKLPRYEGIEAKGIVNDLAVEAVVSRLGLEKLPYSGAISGPVEVAGALSGPYRGTADLVVLAGAGTIPVEGVVHLRFDQGESSLVLRDTFLATPSSRVAVSGTLNQSIKIQAVSRRLEDLPLGELPVKLEGGEIQFDGTLTGQMRAPQVAGQLQARRVRYEKYLAETLTATVVVSPTRLDVTRLSGEVEKATVEGSGSLVLADWKPVRTAPVTARGNVRNVNFKLIPGEWPAIGTFHAAATLSGTLEAPEVTATVDAAKPMLREEMFDTLRATVRYRTTGVEVSGLELTRGVARLTGSGRGAEAGPWSATLAVSGVQLSEWKEMRQWQPELGGQLRGTAKLDGSLRGREPQLTAMDVDVQLREVTLRKKPLGEIAVQGKTQAALFSYTAKGKLREATMEASGAYRLEPGYMGSTSFSLSPLALAVWNDFNAEPLPFTGMIAGRGKFSGPALEPEKWQGNLTVPQLSLRAARRQRITKSANTQDFELSNEGPLEFAADRGVITVGRARFVAKDTNLSVAGTFSLTEKRPWDLRVNGSLNLAGLKTFSPELLAGGVATLEANVRGALDDPQVFGRLDLKDASLFVEDVPSGLDKVTGRVLFDRRRATIENKLTAQSGGGELSLSGFVEFGEAETFYRLQANASGVRVRYPEGLSTVADGAISLTGSPTQSLLAGNITIQRSGFQPRTDLGSLLSDATRGEQSAVSTNEFLTNMQLDIRVRTAPNTQFTTSLTSGLQADANLNVRGSAVRPVVQGRIAVNQGEVNFFGSKYTIKRGEISFYNTSKIEPVLDMDVETRIRAVTVGINFSGPVNKLNVSYRSDPPLAPNEIIALLTVGRSPDSASYTSPGTQNSSLFQTGANTLLGNAITAPISSQLQRFFGVSRIKIDPLISGLEGTPQARLTVEQQVSKDITMTFVTTLNRSQQQVVRLEWNISKEWSVIALRDENGSFGLDFQLRKQLR